jgi:hypothetical protein
MLHHTVLFRWRPGTTPERSAQLARRLEALQGVVPEVRAIHAGPNLDASASEWPFVLLVIVEDQAALQRYLAHPAHVAVAKEIAEVRVARLAADLEV